MHENGVIKNGTIPDIPIFTADSQEYHVFRKRWYVLLVFCAVACMNGVVWNTWGPIGVSAKQVLNWTDANIAIVGICACISGTVSIPVCSWLLDVKGIRWSVLMTSFFLALGTGLRVFTLEMPIFTILAYMCAIIDGFGATIVMSGGPCLSAVWFPPNERTIATALATISTYLGSSAGFLLGPLIMGNAACPVDMDRHYHPWVTTNGSDNTTMINNSSWECIHESRYKLKTLMWLEAGLSIGLFAIVLVYYPAKPPKPPCASATEERIHFYSGIKEAARHVALWLLAIPFATAAGYYFCWTSLLDINLQSIGILQEESGFLGFYGTLVGCATGTLASVFMDVVARKERWVLLGLFTLCTGLSLWFSAICQGWLAFSRAELYITVIGIGATICGAIPLFFEMACETMFPIPEAVISCLLTMWNNLSVIIFFIVFYIPNIGTMWMNWSLVACSAVSVPILVIFPEKYTRLNIDQEAEKATAENLAADVPITMTQMGLNLQNSIHDVLADP